VAGELDMLLDEEVYTWNVSLMELSPEFREDIIRGYDKDSRWSLVIETLKKEEHSKDPIKAILPYLIREGLLYSKDTGGEERLCIPRSIVSQVFKMAHDDAGHQGFDRTYDRLKGLAIYKCTKLLNLSLWTMQGVRSKAT
jgi:integrase-like protein